MAISETVDSSGSPVSNFISLIRGGSSEGIVLLLVIFLIILVVLFLTARLIRKLRGGKSGLESLQASNNRKILINMSSARTIIDRFIQKSTDPAQLRDMKNRLNTLNSELLKIDPAKFTRKAATLEEWNMTEKLLLDNSEKLALELERQLSTVPDIAAIERYTDAVSQAILNRLPVTPELNALYERTSKKDRPEVKIPDSVSPELDHYLNSLLGRYANFSPHVMHSGEYPHEVKWEYTYGNKSISSVLSNSRGISLVFETRWQETDDLDDIVQKEAALVKKNQYKCLCLVNKSWDRESRNFARSYSFPKLALYLHELKGGLYYNSNNTSAEHYEFWFNTELKKETLNELAARYFKDHEFVFPSDIAKALGINERSAQSLLLKLEKKGIVTDVSLESDKIRKYTKAKKKA